MIGIHKDLLERAEQRRPIRFAIVGAGQMGVDIVSEVQQMRGIEVSAVADLDIGRARSAYEIAGVPASRVIETGKVAEANDAVNSGHFVVTDRSDLIPQIERVESVIDATGNPEAGARIGLDCFAHRKHLIMMNVEADVTIGPILRRKAEQAGVIYSMAAGDEPTALMELYSFAQALGLEIVAAGKGKNNPLNREAVPEQYEEEARRRGLTPTMLVEFVDGSKTMIEMAAFANATGLVPDVPDMHGPKTSVPELKKVFQLRQDGGILSKKGVVDYAVGAVAPGVFLNVSTDHPRLRQCLILRDMGTGPVYTLFRPFHLCSMEVPLTVAYIGLYNRPTMQPLDHLATEVTAIAKRDLAPGDVLEGIGGRTHRAGCMVYTEAHALNALPIGLARGCRTVQAIPKGTLITHEMVQPMTETLVDKLRKEQDAFSEQRMLARRF
jgi:predicted homoserine dehydrogenase-like protein